MPYSLRLVCPSVLSFVLAWLGGFRPAVGFPADVIVLHAAVQASPVASHMKEHFRQVDAVQQAVIRGDLESAREPAQSLAEHQEPAGLPAATASQVTAMQTAARQVINATDVRGAAAATASMAASCGTCHKAAGAHPALAEPSQPKVTEGTVGHMLAHQRAVDLMYQGLIVPSDELWKKGADMLKGAPLEKGKLPDDPKLTSAIRAAEDQVHKMADRAARASTLDARSEVYGELISGCATCHSLHGRVWGPGLPKP